MKRLILSLALAIASRSAMADIISTFDLDAEGWKVVDLAPWLGNPPTVQTTYTPVYNAGGGNPGGYIEASDQAGGPWFFFAAPGAFLGDQSSYYGGRLTLDLRVTANDGRPYPLAVLVGDGVALYHRASPPGSSWTSFSVDLAPGSWLVGDYTTGPVATEAQIRAVLGDLTALYIDGDWLSGDETAGLDNVRLSPAPEPAGVALALTALAIVPPALRRRIVA